MTWHTGMARTRAIAWKDLLTDLRGKAGIGAVIAFASLMLVLFAFAIGPDSDALSNATAGIYWLAVLFSGVLTFNRSYQIELDGGAFETLLLYSGGRWPIFLGKLVANIALILAVEVVLVPLTVVLYHPPVSAAPFALVAVVVLGTVGFATMGTFYAAMTSRVRGREVILPLLLFPMLIPLFLAAVQATRALLAGDAMGDSASWIRLLAGFDVLFFTASLLTFEQVIEE
jgi:heme exporter protein B